MKLKNKCAVVTGASQGIGRAIAERLAADGARVAVLDVQEDAAKAVFGGKDGHLGLGCNVADSASVNAAFAKVVEEFGAVDILVCNAGIGRAPNDGSAEVDAANQKRAEQYAAGEAITAYPDQTIYMEDDGFDAVMRVNVNGTFYCCRAALRDMSERNAKGSIVVIGSTSAISGEGALHYVASKAALVGIVRGLAREVAGRGIRVNAVQPGPTDTPAMSVIPQEWKDQLAADVPLGRLADPKEIANAVAFLASDEGSFATGSTLTVNGGSYFC